ncbi:MAG: competence/damage-inducible protein A [Eubacterium sp.]|nr:competence/damage-inducible protein A [Eubacterium sp.]
MKCAILSVGTELLFGQITNTNTVYLSQQMNLLGIDVLYHYTVGDNDGRLEEILNLALSDCDLILTTGGLGPTEDDMTKETVCRVMGDTLVRHEPSMQALLDHAKKRGRVMTENNYKQAMMPSRAVVFDNDKGTAPGFALEKDGKYILCMPGPPREMTRMFQRRALPFLKQFQKDVIYYRTLRLFGKGESSLETDLLDLIDEQTDPTIATYAKEGECQVRIASKAPTRAQAEAAVDAMAEKIRERVGEFIYSENDEELADVVGKYLIEKGVTISCAESCTGGMFASDLISVPGISDVFERGLVTYTWRAKEEELGVRHETLENYTAFSPEVAREMAEGLWKKTGSRICISVTGIAGPGGGDADNPPGSAYIGLSVDGECTVHFQRGRDINRHWNRHYLVLTMLDLVRRAVIRMP